METKPYHSYVLHPNELGLHKLGYRARQAKKQKSGQKLHVLGT